jgi:hypothetical protein
MKRKTDMFLTLQLGISSFARMNQFMLFVESDACQENKLWHT